jgi:hypothetical protein
MDTKTPGRLQELDRSNFEIVKGEPDIRGWDVKNRIGHKIGAVEELIVDAQEKKVRYMVVDLDDNELKLKHRKVLIPIGLAELDQKHDDVLMPNVSLDQVCLLPDYDKNNLTPDVERRISSTFGRTIPATSAELEEKYAPTGTKTERKIEKEKRKEELRNDEIDPDFYRHEQYNLDNLYKNRLQEMEPAKKSESEYERGLRLWERRSEGGIIDEGNRQANEETYKTNEEEKRRMRRTKYRERRYNENDQAV